MSATYKDVLRAISLQHSATKHASRKREIWQQTVTFWSLANAMLGFVYKVRPRHCIGFLRSVFCLWLILHYRELSLSPYYSSYDLRFKENKAL